MCKTASSMTSKDFCIHIYMKQSQLQQKKIIYIYVYIYGRSKHEKVGSSMYIKHMYDGYLLVNMGIHETVNSRHMDIHQNTGSKNTHVYTAIFEQNNGDKLDHMYRYINDTNKW